MAVIDGEARERMALPQLRGRGLFVTDGGLETELVFHDGRDLPAFAAFPLLDSSDGRARLRRYYRGYLDIARANRAGFVLETPTWRANPDWAGPLGYTGAALDEINQASVALARQICLDTAADGVTTVVSGCVGPRGDGYDPGAVMSADEAQSYHAQQIVSFAAAEVDQVTAITMTNAAEAIGVVRAARAAEIPSAISLTVETDGRLPTGQPLDEAIAEIDTETDAWAAYFMVNCAHPTHFSDAFHRGGAWRHRVLGLRSNASAKSHAELDEATELDDGDPTEFGAQHAGLRELLPGVRVLGGCCGTDARHVAAVVAAWSGAA